MTERLLTGLQPTGNLTIGNYCGGIRQILLYQEKYDTSIFVPDLHAITVTHDPLVLRQKIREVVALYLACGVNPKKCHIFIQSENLYHTNLAWILECHSYIGELARMTQFKMKKQDTESTSCGLFTYPVLMAADILLYNTNYVPAGIDQKQHIELARNIAARINKRYGELVVLPKPLIPQIGAKIRDLQDPEKKMSKSNILEKSSIYLLDGEKEIRKKIMGAKTDSENKVYYDEHAKPGISNLLTIFAAFRGITTDECKKMFEHANYGELKNAVSNVLVEVLMPIQEKYKTIMGEKIVDDILDEGAKYAIEYSRGTYERLKSAIGLGR